MLDKPTALNTFRDTFIRELSRALLNELQELEGTIPLKEGAHEKRTRNAMEPINTALGAIPVVGNIATAVGQTIGTFIHKGFKEKRRQELKEKKSKLANEDSGALVTGEMAQIESALKLPIEEAAFEISRIFEYQITSRENLTYVETMAKEAVERFLEHFKNHEEVSFDRNGIVLGVIHGHSKVQKTPVSITDKVRTRIDSKDKDDEEAWFSPSVFERPGLTSWDTPGKREYHQNNKAEEKEKEKFGFKKYGFREMYTTWSKDNGYEEEAKDAKDDKQNAIWTSLEEDDVPDELQNHKPYYIRVTGKDITDYLKKVKTENDNGRPIPSFNDFIGKRYFGKAFRQDQKVSAVIAELPQQKNKALSYGDFSNTVWMHMDLSHYNLSHCNFDNACLMHTNLSETNITGTSFKNADLRLTDLSEIKESAGANFESANLYRANLSRSQFTKNVHFVNAQMQSADVTQTNLSGSDMTDVKAEGANLCDAQLPPTIHQQMKNVQQVLDGYKHKLDEIQKLLKDRKPQYDIENVGFASGADASKFGGTLSMELFKGELPASHDLTKDVDAMIRLQGGAAAALNQTTKTIRSVAFEAGSTPPNKDAGGVVTMGLASYTLTSSRPQPSSSASSQVSSHTAQTNYPPIPSSYYPYSSSSSSSSSSSASTSTSSSYNSPLSQGQQMGKFGNFPSSQPGSAEEHKETEQSENTVNNSGASNLGKRH